MSEKDPEEMSDEELFEAYERLVDEGETLGARGMSFGSVVMESAPLKQEMKERGIWGDR